MSYLAVNWLAIVVAMVASMGLGVAWYMGLSRQWMAAAGVTAEHVNSGDRSPFIFGALMQLVMAYFIALLTPVLFGSTNALNGVLCAVHMWLGFGITAMVLNHRYQGKPWALTLIDGGYLLGVLVVQGIVIGLFG